LRTRAIDSTTYTPLLSFVGIMNRSPGGFKRAFCAVCLIEGSVEHVAILPANRWGWRLYRLGFGFFSVPTPSKQHSSPEYHYQSYANRVFVHTSLVQSQSIVSLTGDYRHFPFSSAAACSFFRCRRGIVTRCWVLSARAPVGDCYGGRED
jgi:hypothetical protein